MGDWRRRRHRLRHQYPVVFIYEVKHIKKFLKQKDNFHLSIGHIPQAFLSLGVSQNHHDDAYAQRVPNRHWVHTFHRNSVRK